MSTGYDDCTCSKLGTLNQHGFPLGILPTTKQVPSLDNILPGLEGMLHLGASQGNMLHNR